jgi:hypothetical protein
VNGKSRVRHLSFKIGAKNGSYLGKNYQVVRLMGSLLEAFEGRLTAFCVELSHLIYLDVKISYEYQNTLMDF